MFYVLCTNHTKLISCMCKYTNKNNSDFDSDIFPQVFVCDTFSDRIQIQPYLVGLITERLSPFL